MAYELKEGQGSLFRVEEKANENGPDYEGKVMAGGVTYRLAGWLKAASSGKKYLSLKAEVPRAALTSVPKKQAADDDDIEF